MPQRPLPKKEGGGGGGGGVYLRGGKIEETEKKNAADTLLGFCITQRSSYENFSQKIFVRLIPKSQYDFKTLNFTSE